MSKIFQLKIKKHFSVSDANGSLESVAVAPNVSFSYHTCHGSFTIAIGWELATGLLLL